MTRTLLASLLALGFALAVSPVIAGDTVADTSAQSTEAAPSTADKATCDGGAGCCGGGGGCGAVAADAEDGTPANECPCQRRRRLQEKARQNAQQ